MAVANKPAPDGTNISPTPSTPKPGASASETQEKAPEVDLKSLDPSAAVESLRLQLSSLGLNSQGNKKTLKTRLAGIKRHGMPVPKTTLDEENEKFLRERVELEWLLVIDFEATCEARPNQAKDSNEDTLEPTEANDSPTAQDSGDLPDDSPTPEQARARHEIIEFPIVLVDLKSQCIKAKFQRYVKPSINPTLSQFCKDLTGITQSQIDDASSFEQVLKEAEEWLMLHCTDFNPPISKYIESNDALRLRDPSGHEKLKTKGGKGPRYRRRNWSIVTDGTADMELFFRLQCYISRLKFPDWTLGPYIDLRELVAAKSGLGRMTIHRQLAYLKLVFEGREHSGLDDAVNVARIVMALKERGGMVVVNRYMEEIERGWIYGPGKRSAEQIRGTRALSGVETLD